ncbi:MAG TPA: YggT family protein [Acidimicrobiales bacterium]|jgi:YggT family protein|nr:YggT family protein [Acidimicrobiales bacterium]
MALRIIVDLLQFYVVVLFVRIVLSWFPIHPWSRLARVVRVLAAVTDPVLAPVRRVLPPLRVGSMGLDLSPLVVLFALQLVVRLLELG